MAIIYVLTILMGTQSRGLFETSANGGIAPTQIAGHYFGSVGQLILAVTITFACLKTSIGLVTSCSETFVKMTHGKISTPSGRSSLRSSRSRLQCGPQHDHRILHPMLMLIYPPAIVLIILAFAGKLFGHDRRVYVSTMVFTWAAAIFDFMKTLPGSLQESLHLDTLVSLAGKCLPLFDKNLGWLIPPASALSSV